MKSLLRLRQCLKCFRAALLAARKKSGRYDLASSFNPLKLGALSLDWEVVTVWFGISIVMVKVSSVNNNMLDTKEKWVYCSFHRLFVRCEVL